MKQVTYARNVKINTGNFENTDVHYKVTMDVEEGQDLDKALQSCEAIVEEYLKAKIDEIELGTRKAKSKASRFGLT